MRWVCGFWVDFVDICQKSGFKVLQLGVFPRCLLGAWYLHILYKQSALRRGRACGSSE